MEQFVIDAAKIVAEETGLPFETVARFYETGEGIEVREVEIPDDCRCCGTTEEWVDGPNGSSCIGSRSGAF